MTATGTPVTARSAWQLLAAHERQVKGRSLRELFAADPARGEQLTAEAAGVYLDYSKQRITDETKRLLLALAEESDLAARIDAMFRGEKINGTENRAALHVALRAPKGVSIVVDGEDVVPGVHQVLERMASFAQGVRSGEWKGHDGPADTRCRQHRHRRLRPRAGDGLRGAAALQRPGAHVSLRVERRRHRLRRGRTRPRSGRDPVHRRVEDVHDAGDDDQCPCGARLAARGIGRGREGRGPAFRRRVDQRGEGGRIRDRHREHVRLLGLGRRPLFDGLGDRPVDDARDRAGPFSRDARWLPRHGRAFPAGALRAQPAGADGTPRASGTTIFSGRIRWRCCRTSNT